MKPLTKDDFENICKKLLEGEFYASANILAESIEQILENQVDARQWNKFKDILESGELVHKDTLKMIERVKKHCIEMISYYELRMSNISMSSNMWYQLDLLVTELKKVQKIMEINNGNN